MLNQKDNVKKTPINEVSEMKKKGLTNEQIIGSLSDKSYSHEQISSAMDQSNIKQEATTTTNTLLPPSGNGGVPLGLTNAPSPTSEHSKEPQSPSPISPVTTPIQSSDLMSVDSMPAERASYEMVEEIAESVVKEKWEELLHGIGDISRWKEKTETDIQAIKQEILRTQQRFDNLQTAALGKVKEYGEDIREIGTEMQAIEKVLSKIITPLTTNIKELSRITGELKKKK